MRTKIIKINPKKPEISKIKTAAEILKKGGLVAFPTETVYGLGANALDEKAVLKIFQAKRRPLDNPVIVHIASLEDIELLAYDVPQIAYKLASKFWPGPLTLVLPKCELVPDVVSAGLPIVAVRMPSHPIARQLILKSELPIAAPSANLAGRPSPTNAEHVIQDLWGRIDLILDGGEVEHGLESTVLDLTEKVPTILRPGPITPKQLKPVIGKVKIHPVAKAESVEEMLKAKSPGMKYRHYAPKAKLILVEGDLQSMVEKIKQLYDKYSSFEKRVGILATSETASCYGTRSLRVSGSRDDCRSIAKNLFKMLREFDKLGFDVIIAEGLEPHGLGLAIMNRLRKASGKFRIKLNSNFL